MDALTTDRWAVVHEWVDGHRQTISGYLRNHYYLSYSAYEMDDFLAEAYLIAYEALEKCGDGAFEGWFWTMFKNRCKTLANKPHNRRCIDIKECSLLAPSLTVPETRGSDDMNSQLMKIEDLIEYTRLERQTIYNYTHLRKIPYLKVGGLRFIKAEIDEWLTRGSTMEAACDIMIKAGRSHMVDLRLMAVLGKQKQ